jgi:hypothetical protein
MDAGAISWEYQLTTYLERVNASTIWSASAFAMVAGMTPNLGDVDTLDRP